MKERYYYNETSRHYRIHHKYKILSNVMEKLASNKCKARDVIILILLPDVFEEFTVIFHVKRVN